VLLNFHYLVKPELAFHHYEYQHKGPVHVGKLIMSIRAYSWTDKQIHAYVKYREEEELDLLKEINSSIEEAMNALGDDLKKYLKQAGEKFEGDKEEEPAEEKKENKMPGFLEPFMGVVGGFGELFQGFGPKKAPKKKGAPPPKKKEKKADYKVERNEARAGAFARAAAWDGYQRFKEHHELLHW